MVKYQSKEKLVKFDKKLADKLVDIIRNKNYCKEMVEETLALLDEFSNSAEYKEEIITLERNETEDEAKFSLGEDFVSQYQQILNICKENDLMMYIHGTKPEIAEKIIDEGLAYKSPQIQSTAINMDLENPQYSMLLNWPHQSYKGLVVALIPKESFGKFWVKNGEGVKGASAYNYTIHSEFLLGMIDIEKKSFIKNEKFCTNHDYNKFIGDYELGPWLEHARLSEDSEHISQTSETDMNTNTTNTTKKSWKEIKTEIEETIEEDIKNHESAPDELMELGLEEIISGIVQFSSENHSKKDWFRLSEIGKRLFIVKKYAEYLDKNKSKFITREKRSQLSGSKQNNNIKFDENKHSDNSFDSWGNETDWS